MVGIKKIGLKLIREVLFYLVKLLDQPFHVFSSVVHVLTNVLQINQFSSFLEQDLLEN